MHTEHSATGLTPLPRGLTTLTCVILLLSLVTIVGSFSAKITQLNFRIALNALHKLRIDERATSALQSSISLLPVNGAQNPLITPSFQDDLYQYQTAGRLIELPKLDSISMVNLSATVSSIASTTTTTRQQALFTYSLLASIPAAPLIVRGAIFNSHTVKLVANSNGGGSNVPVSIWTTSSMDNIQHLPTTCQRHEFDNAGCVTHSLTQPGYKESDIVDGSLAFPEDLFHYLFPYDSTNWLRVKDQASDVVPNCDNLSNHSEGLVWVEGDCRIPLGSQLGSAESPILLAIEEGALSLPSGTELFGLVFLLQTQHHRTVEVEVFGTANIHGSVVSTSELRFSRGHLNIIYDVNVLDNLRNLHALAKVAVVAGSWRDF